MYYKPMIASVLAIFASVAVYLPIFYRMNSMALAFFLALIVAVLVYAVFAVCFKIITAEDIAILPMGEKILSLWRSFHKEKRKGKTEI